ncbi:MAG: hypothetical protein WA687_13295, partial [Solirubrobacterales bacterium]
GSAAALCDRIEASGVLRQVRSRALEMVAEGKRRLGTAGFDAERRKLFDLVADGVVQRYS